MSLSYSNPAVNIHEDVVDWNKYDVISPQKLTSGAKRSNIAGDLSTMADVSLSKIDESDEF